METWLKELRYAVRTFGKTPGFTLVALLTPALGIGANTAIFSVVHAVLARQLPFREPDQLHWVWTRHTSTDRYPFQLPGILRLSRPEPDARGRERLRELERA